MPGPDVANVVAAAMALRSMEPQLWDNFTAAMREHANAVALQILQVPPELLPRAQGMALQAQETAQLLKNAPEHMKRMQDHGRRTERT